MLLIWRSLRIIGSFGCKPSCRDFGSPESGKSFPRSKHSIVFVHCCSYEPFYAVYVDKLARLNSLKLPNLVLVGGSNLSFGIDTLVDRKIA